MTEITNTKHLIMDEIFNNLLSCSEKDTPLEDIVHVYDPRELQSGWRSVSCNAKYMAYPEAERVSPLLASGPSVKNDSSSFITKQKRPVNKEKKKDLKQKEMSVNFNKYESVGVLSYDVPSWRTIVDPETYAYLKRSHPCHLNDARTKTSGGKRGIRFVDPGVALDLHLGGFVKRQSANKTMQFSVDENIRNTITAGQSWANSMSQVTVKPHDLPQSQRICTFPDERVIRPLPRKNVIRLADIPTAPKPKANITPTITIKCLKGIKAGIHNPNLPSLANRELSPLATANSFPGKTPKVLAQNQQLRHFSLFNKPFAPVNVDLLKLSNQSPRGQKLNWLPITSTSLCVPRNGGISVYQSGNPQLEWSKMNGLSHNTINQAITQLKSQLPEKRKIVLTARLQPNISSKVLELPLTSTGLH